MYLPPEGLSREKGAMMGDGDMRALWLHRQGAERCLLFFAGWGMDARPFAPLASGGVDALMIHSYRGLELPELASLRDYAEVTLLAWSFGVWVAARTADAELLGRCRERIALGGTLHPVDEKRGLSPDRFAAVLADFDEARLAEFYAAMFDDPAHLALFRANRPDRPLPDLRAELAFLHDASLSAPEPSDIFTRRIVTARDRIFSGRNQFRAWGREGVRGEPWPHFPFYRFGSWGELIDALCGDAAPPV